MNKKLWKLAKTLWTIVGGLFLVIAALGIYASFSENSTTKQAQPASPELADSKSSTRKSHNSEVTAAREIAEKSKDEKSYLPTEADEPDQVSLSEALSSIPPYGLFLGITPEEAKPLIEAAKLEVINAGKHSESIGQFKYKGKFAGMPAEVTIHYISSLSFTR